MVQILNEKIRPIKVRANPIGTVEGYLLGWCKGHFYDDQDLFREKQLMVVEDKDGRLYFIPVNDVYEAQFLDRKKEEKEEE